jgi:voltage-gated potassium channel
MAPDQTSRERLLAWASGREQRKGLRPRDAAILIISVWFLAIVVFGVAEHLVEPKTFPTAWLGMWWALESVTTVGYGDVVPVGTAGRIIASFLLLGGLAFLTVIIAMITSGFVARYHRQASAASEDRLVQCIEQLSLELKEVHAEVQGLRPAGNGSETGSPAQAGSTEAHESPASPDH